MNEVLIQVKKELSTPLYMQIYQQLKSKIINGEVEPNTRLPSIRDLAQSLGISRNTVTLAYDQLLDEGYITSRVRSGYYVQQMDTELLHTMPEIRKTDWKKEEEKLTQYEFDFTWNKIDQHSFPLTVWRRLVNRCFREEVEELFHYGDPQGELGLRREIAAYLKQSRGVNCSEDQIIIGSHSQYLLTLACQMIGLNQQTVAFENPGYYAAREVLKLLNFKVKSIPVKEDGIDINLLQQSKASFVYVTPSHQIPLGVIMPVSKRLELLEWAVKNGCYIFEDDVNSEFRYTGEPIPALKHFDQHDRVIYMGTFFKSLLPSIRLNYMVLPRELLDIYHKDYSIYQQTTSKTLQKTVELFMKEGHWIKHVRRMRKIYKKKYDWMVHYLKLYFGDHIRLLGDAAGHHVVIQVKGNGKDWLRLAEKNGVKVDSLALFLDKSFESTNDKNIFLLTFSALTEEEIHNGIKRLHESWFSK